MQRRWIPITALILFTVCLHSKAPAVGPPFADIANLKSMEGADHAYNRLTGLYQLRINSIPYLLTRYLNTGSVNILHIIKETMYSIDATVEAMGKTIANDRDKETFAKLLGGSDKLEKSVSRNIKAIKEFRRLSEVYSLRSEDLLILICAAPTTRGCNIATFEDDLEEPELRRLEKLRVLLLKRAQRGFALPFKRAVPPSAQPNESQMWDEATDLAHEVAVSLESKGYEANAVRLRSMVENVGQLARSLTVGLEEINQSWEEVMIAVGSLEAITHSSGPKGEKTSETEKNTAGESED